jgi:hypothetical protein
MEPDADGLAKWLIGGAFTVIAGIITAIWKFSHDWVQHWKNLYEAKVKELELKGKDLVQVINERNDLKENTEAHAMVFIEGSKKKLNAQIEKLETSIQKLKRDLEAKEIKISNLMNLASKNEEEFLFAKEAKENLEKKIEVYNGIVQSLLRRKQRAVQAFDTFSDKTLDVSKLDAEVNEELHQNISAIDASSFKEYAEYKRKASREASAASEARANLEMVQRRRELEEAEEKTERREAMRIPLPPHEQPFGAAPVDVTRRKRPRK